MTSFRPRRPRAALVISVIALIAALGGTAYAGVVLGKNSVGTKQLKNGAVTTKKIKDGAVTAAKINSTGLTVPNAVHATSANSATTATSATNATNATNATHATSADSATAAGSAGALTGVQIVRSALITNTAALQNYGQANCPAGQYVIGGGVYGSASATVQNVNSSWPTRQSSTDPQPDAWGAYMNNTDTVDHTFNVYAICTAGSVSSNYTGSHSRKH